MYIIKNDIVQYILGEIASVIFIIKTPYGKCVCLMLCDCIIIISAVHV